MPGFTSVMFATSRRGRNQDQRAFGTYCGLRFIIPGVIVCIIGVTYTVMTYGLGYKMLSFQLLGPMFIVVGAFLLFIGVLFISGKINCFGQNAQNPPGPTPAVYYTGQDNPAMMQQPNMTQPTGRTHDYGYKGPGSAPYPTQPQYSQPMPPPYTTQYWNSDQQGQAPSIPPPAYPGPPQTS